MNGKKFAIPALLFGVFGTSMGAIFARMAVAGGAPALSTSAYRLLIASLLLWPVILISKRDELKSLTKRDFLCTFTAGIFLAIHFATWISSLDYTSVASSVVLVNTAPLWVGIASPFMGEKVSRMTMIAIVLSIIGGSIVGWGDFSVSRLALFGDVLALIGGIAVSGYLVCGRKVRKKLSLLTYVGLCYGTAALCLCTMNISAAVPMFGFSDTVWLAFLGSAVVPQIIGHTSYNWALGYFSASFVAVALLGEPIGSSIMAFYLFNEFPSPIMFVGFAFLFVSIVLAAKSEQE